MRPGRFIIFFVLLLIAQILVCNFLNLSQYLMITILPTLILCVPNHIKTHWLLIIAFAAGFAVDFFSTGALGLCCAALLPVAFLRNTVLKAVYGNDLFLRKEEISLAKHGHFNMSVSILLCLLLYIILFVWIDAAGTRPFWFNALKCVISLTVSYFCSLPIARMLCP